MQLYRRLCLSVGPLVCPSHYLKSHPRIAHGQRYPMPCLSDKPCPASDKLKKWSESRAAAPKGRCPVGHRGEFPYILRGHSWGLSSNFPWYLIGILHFYKFSSIFHVIQWETCIFLHFCKFSMLFNGKFAFLEYPMLSNENLRLEKLREGGDGRTDGRTDGWTEVWTDI